MRSKQAKKKPETGQQPDDIQRILERAQAGDESAVPALRKLLSDAKMLDRVIGGDLSQVMAHHVANKASGNNLAFREITLRRLELMKEELAGPNPTAVETLLVNRVALCWLVLHGKEAMYYGHDNPTWQEVECGQRIIDRCHRRYLAALRTLAIVRRLAVPVLQVNVADQQINVANGNQRTKGRPKSKRIKQ